MADMSDTREFIRGAASRRDRVYTITKMRDLIRDEVAHASVIGLEAGRWVSVETVDWDASAIAIARLPAPRIVVVGEDGDVVTKAGSAIGSETLPGEPVAIRNARTIAGQTYACGMQRQVYRRIGEAQWIEMSAPRGAPTEPIGFEAIDGYGENEIYAVGWGGELWEHDGTRWSQHAVPTNVVLAAVCCAPNGTVYAAGQQGIMLRGRHAAWDIIDWTDPVEADLWDLCWFQDKLYVSTATGLCTLDGQALVDVDFGPLGALSCFSLTSAEDTLWSIGHADVASFDGKTWRRYP